MIRAACLVARHFPLDFPDAAAPGILAGLASGLAANGVAVHVFHAGSRDSFDTPGISLHALSLPVIGDREADALNWALAVEDARAEWDPRVGFDVVIAPDSDGAGMKLSRGASSSVVVQMLGGSSARHGELVARMTALALHRADLVIAPSPELAALAETSTAASVQVLAPTVAPLPAALPAQPDDEPDRFELLLVGSLLVGSRTDLGLEVLAGLRRAGIRCELSVVGSEPTGRRRREVFFSAMDRLELGGADVTFYDALSPAALSTLLARSDVVLAPEQESLADVVVLHGLQSGIPALVAGPRLVPSPSETDHLLRVLPAEPERYVAAAVAEVARIAASPTSRARVEQPSLDPRDRAAPYLALFESLERGARIPPALRRPTQSTPRLGLVLLGAPPTDADPAGSRRGFLSFLEHTEVPAEIVCIGHGPDLELLDSFADPRLRLLASTGAPTEDLRRAFELFEEDLEYVVVADARLEATAKWWEPYIEVLRVDPGVGLVTDLASTLEQDTVVPAGAVLVLRRSVLEDIGDIDPSMGWWWQADLACRAGRVGARLGILESGERLLSWPRDVAVPLEADADERFRARHLRGVISATTPFLLLADLDEALSCPELLSAYSGAFDANDEVALVLLGIGQDPQELELRLQVAANRARLDLEQGPRVMALVPPSASPREQALIADEMGARLGNLGTTGRHLPSFGALDAAALRLLAARTWAARPLPSEPGVPAGARAS